MARLPGQRVAADQAGPAWDYETLTAAGGTGVTLERPFRAILVITSGAVTLRNSKGVDVAFGTLGAGIWDFAGNYVTAAPADLILLY